MTTTATASYAENAARVEQALRKAFPQDTIALSEGYQGRVHAKVVSSRFNGLSEREKQALIWEVLQAEMGAEAQVVSLAMVWGTDELA